MGKNCRRALHKDRTGRYMARFQYKGEQYTLYHKTSVKQLVKDMNNMKYELEHGLYASAKKVKVDDWYNAWMNEYKAHTVKKSTFVYMIHITTFILKIYLGRKSYKI